MFSDPDEIPDPNVLSHFRLNKKYGIFKQKCFNYKLNLLIKYNDFVKNPKKTIDKIYKFLEVKPFKHTFKNIKQFEVNNVKYDDSVMGTNMHTIKTKKIEKTKRDIKKLLPDSVIKEWDIPELKVWTN